MAILKNTPTNPKKGPGKGKVKEKLKKDSKTGRQYSVADKEKKVAKPIYTKNPKDPRIKAYNDSLSRYESPTNKFRDIPYEKPVQPVKYKKPVAKSISKVKPSKSTVKTKSTSMTGKKSKPTSKAVEKPKSIQKEPRKTMKVDTMTEKEIMEKKKSFESKAGKPYMSKDESYNKLERKLGRKPTVAEYNKSLK
jgi:hypothetical protein